MKQKDNSHQSGHRTRLRQRFLTGGNGAVAQYEILEMLLYAAHPRGDVKPLAKDLIKTFGSLFEVVCAQHHQLRKVDGIGDASIAAIKIIETATQTFLKQRINQKKILADLSAVIDYCNNAMAHLKEEQMRILFLNHQQQLMEDELLNTGNGNSVSVYPRSIVQRAIDLGAYGIILAHNHPSGNPEPSQADIDVTYKIQHVVECVGIRLYDHLIIAQNKYCSFKEQGLL